MLPTWLAADEDGESWAAFRNFGSELLTLPFYFFSSLPSRFSLAHSLCYSPASSHFPALSSCFPPHPSFSPPCPSALPSPFLYILQQVLRQAKLVAVVSHGGFLSTAFGYPKLHNCEFRAFDMTADGRYLRVATAGTTDELLDQVHRCDRVLRPCAVLLCQCQSSFSVPGVMTTAVYELTTRLAATYFGCVGSPVLLSQHVATFELYTVHLGPKVSPPPPHTHTHARAPHRPRRPPPLCTIAQDSATTSGSCTTVDTTRGGADHVCRLMHPELTRLSQP